MALELMVLLEKNLGITLTESLVFEHPTIEELVRYFLGVLFPAQASASPAAAAAPVAAASPAPSPADPSADAAWSDQLQQVAALSDDELLRQLRGEG
jgi:hypothetical protein